MYEKKGLKNKKKTHVPKLFKQMELALSHHSFYPIQQKYLMNLGRFLRNNRGDGGMIILTEVTLPVSRERKAELMEKLGYDLR